MISKRVTYFVRRITVCLTICTMIVLFALSCQKDEGIKQKDPKALTTAQAKEYFEQNAQTLKFITNGITSVGTKYTNYSLTDNMVIEWEQALEGENAESFFVEIPIRMVSPVAAVLYDGIGHLNKNIRQVQMNASLIIEKQKDEESFHHFVVTTVGTYSSSINAPQYCFLSNKTFFSGYQIFSTEEGRIIKSLYYLNGSFQNRVLYNENDIHRIYGQGKDLIYRGIYFITSYHNITKGGGGTSTGESTNCLSCGRPIDPHNINNSGIYICECGAQYLVLIDPESNIWNYETCSECGFPLPICICICSHCGYNKNECICNSNGSGNGNGTGNGSGNGSGNGNGTGAGGNGGNGGSGDSGWGNHPGIDLTGFYQVLVYVDSTPAQGTVSIYPDTNLFAQDSSITITAYPYAGYQFVGWKLNSVIVSNSNPYIFNASAHETYYAVFTIDD